MATAVAWAGVVLAVVADACTPLVPNYQDGLNNNCSRYVEEGWCTPYNDYGLLWVSWENAFNNPLLVSGGNIPATDACCGCGVGVCKDREWMDSRGLSCRYYAQHVCSNGSATGPLAEYAVGNVSAAEACCACGGGCQSLPSWQDSRGNTCSTYYQSQWCAWSGGLGPGWNSSWGGIEDYATNNVSAWDACCECSRCPDDVTISNQAELESYAATGCTMVRRLEVRDIVDLRLLSHLRHVRYLIARDIGSFAGLEGTLVDELVRVQGSGSLKGLGGLSPNLGGLQISSMETMRDLSELPLANVTRIGSIELVQNPELLTLAALGGLREVGAVLLVDNVKLISLHGLEGLRSMEFQEGRFARTTKTVDLIQSSVQNIDALGGVQGAVSGSLDIGLADTTSMKTSVQGLLGMSGACTHACEPYGVRISGSSPGTVDSLCMPEHHRDALVAIAGSEPRAVIPNATFQGCHACSQDCGRLSNGYPIPCDYNVGICSCPLGTGGPNCSLPTPEVHMLPGQSQECVRPRLVEGTSKSCEVCIQVQTNNYDMQVLDPPRTVRVDPASGTGWAWPQSIEWQSATRGQVCINITLQANDPPTGLETIELVTAYSDFAQDWFLPGTLRDPLQNPVEPFYPWCLDSGDCTRMSTLSNDTVSFTLLISEPPIGRAEFQFEEMVVTEGRNDVAVVLFRTGGDYGSLSVTVEVDVNGTTAIPGLQYNWTDELMSWTHGDDTPKTFVMTFPNNEAYQPAANLSLRIATHDARLTVVITDDGDAGVLGFSAQRRAIPERIAQGSCLLYASRTGGSSGRAQAQVALGQCDAGEALATEGEDFVLLPGVLTWEDEVMGEQCAVFGTAGLPQVGATPGQSQLAIFEDAESEGDESVCFRLLPLPGSSAEVTDAETSTFASRATLVLQDLGASGGPAQAHCTRGRPCSLDLSQSELVQYLADEAWTSGGENSVVLAGRSCASCGHPTAATSLVALNRNYTAGWQDLSIDPGQYFVCLCQCSGNSCPGCAVTTLTMAGAKGGQQATCSLGQPCQLDRLQGVELQAGDVVTAAESCGETELLPGLPAPGMAADTLGDGTYTFPAPAWLLSSSGVFSLCWCRPDSSPCAAKEDFAVQVGLFKAEGPQRGMLVECRQNATCEVRGLQGTGLRAGDKLMALETCGSASAVEWGAEYPVATTSDGENYSFGLVSQSTGPVLRQLELCWCPAGAACSSPSDFRSLAGNLELLCPSGLYWPTLNGVPQRAGECQACSNYQKTIQSGAIGRAACVCQTEADGWRFQEVNEGNCGCRDGFHWSSSAEECVPCNAGQSCQWENLYAQSLELPPLVPGFWSTQEGSVYRCFSRFTCPYTNSECATGRSGKACSLCAVGFVGGHDGECQPFEERCSHSTSDANLALFVPLFILATLVACTALLLIIAHRKRSIEQRTMNMTSAYLSAWRTSVAQNFQYLQLLSIVSLFEVRWPTVLAEVWDWLRSITMDLVTVPSLGCILPEHSAFSEMLVKYLVPVALAAATVLSWGLLRLLRKCLKFAPGKAFQAAREKIDVTRSQVLEVLMLAGCLFFSVLVRNGFILFTCARGPNEISTVVLYPHIDCPSVSAFGDLSDWFEILPYALAYNVVFSFGLTFGVRHAARATVQYMVENDFTSRGAWGFLSDEFRDTYTWWLLVKMTRDLLINVLAAVFTNLGSVQLLSTAVVSMFYGYWCESSHPYKDPLNNMLETWCAVSVGAICFFAAGMGYAYDSDNDYSRAYLEEGGPQTDATYRDQILLTFQLVSFAVSLGIMFLNLAMVFPAVRQRVPARYRLCSAEELEESKVQLRGAFQAADIQKFDDIEVTRNLKILNESPATLGTASTELTEMKRARSGISVADVIPGRAYMSKVSKQASKRSLSSSQSSLRASPTMGSVGSKGGSDGEMSPSSPTMHASGSMRSDEEAAKRASPAVGSVKSDGSRAPAVGSMKSDESTKAKLNHGASRETFPDSLTSGLSPVELYSSPGSDEKATNESDRPMAQSAMDLATQEGTTILHADNYVSHIF